MRATFSSTSVKSAASWSRAFAASRMISAARANCGRKLSSRGNSLSTAPRVSERLHADFTETSHASEHVRSGVAHRAWQDRNMIRRSRALRAFVVLLPAFALAAAVPAPAPAPKLAVVISVDGLGWARLEGYRPWFVAGLKRLLDEGHVERAARYQHLNTETGPGHASLGTGAPPRVTGIVANSWFEAGDDGSLHTVYCTDQRDPAAPAGSARVIPGPGNLRVPTLGDRLVEAKKGARVAPLTAKARRAIFLAARKRAHSVSGDDKEAAPPASAPEEAPPSAVRLAVRRFNETKAGTMLPGRF